MTLSTLISNYRKTQVVTHIKKTVSLMENAIKMAEAKHGFTEEWSCDFETRAECMEFIFNEYLAPELQVIKTCIPTSYDCFANVKSLDGKTGYLAAGTDWASNVVSAILNNGTSLYMWSAYSVSNYLHHIQVWFDIDGPKKGKNTLGADVFGIIIRLKETNVSDTGEIYRKGVYIIAAEKDVTREDLTTGQYGCAKDVSGQYAGRSCGALIQYEGWKIPDDYPVRF